MNKEKLILRAAIETEGRINETYNIIHTAQQHLEETYKNQNVIFELALPIIIGHVRDNITEFTAEELMELEAQAAAGNPIYSLHSTKTGIFMEFKDGTTKTLKHTRHINVGF